MWPVIPALAILMAQAPQPNAPSKSYEWCFEIGKGSTLCKGHGGRVHRVAPH
jgi:hypothetical protein